MNQRIAMTVEVEENVFVVGDIMTDEKGHVVEVGVRDTDGEWHTAPRASGTFATTLSFKAVAKALYQQDPSAFGRHEVPRE